MSRVRIASRKYDYSEIKRLLDVGTSKREICTQLGMHANSLKYILNSNNWQPVCIEHGCTKGRWLQAKRCTEHAEKWRNSEAIKKSSQWRKDNPEKYKEHGRLAKLNGSSRKHSTGFTNEMFSECWKIQDGKCGLCEMELNSLTKKNIHSDHVPETFPPKPRGILCGSCNTHWIGRLESFERNGDCKITNLQLLEWKSNPPMSKSSFAKELGWK